MKKVIKKSVTIKAKKSKPTKGVVKNKKSKYPYVIVRTYSAGVFAGNFIKRNGGEVLLKNARRIWKWEGAASLSQLAMHGTSKPNECKFPCEVDEIQLINAIEIIKATKKAEMSIKGVPIWSE